MNNIDLLDKFKDAYLELLIEKSGNKFDGKEHYFSYDYSLIDSIEKDIKNINLSIEFFFKARNKNDALGMRAALIDLRCFMIGIYGVFYQSVEDIEHLFHITDDVVFPEDYKVPEHYNYPFK